MAIIPTKDSDVEYDRKNTNSDPQRLNDNEEEDYEVVEDEYFTTLRKSSAFTLQRYSMIFHEDIFFILLPMLEAAMKS